MLELAVPALFQAGSTCSILALSACLRRLTQGGANGRDGQGVRGIDLELYDRFMVPLIFEPYARDLADRLAKARPKDLLETAAGTGVLTRRRRRTASASTRITVTDLNQPMLDYAKARLPGDGRIAWKQADASCAAFGTKAMTLWRVSLA